MSISVMSWSGGKDSMLALHNAHSLGLTPKYLLTMMDETGLRSRSHGLNLAFLNAQASALNMILITAKTSWQSYEAVFIQELEKLQKVGVTHAIFGDIDIEDHKIWEEKVSNAAGLIAILPLWKQARLDLVHSVLAHQIKPIICTIQKSCMSVSFVGRVLDQDCVDELCALGIDPCGEAGEFHTAVIDGPNFKERILYELGELHEIETSISVDLII